jgi:cohesin complex subunit SA-1/2
VEDADELIAQDRLRATIVAEQRLCELTGKIVLAVIGRVLDASGPQRGKLKQKLLRNRSRLGHNYKEVLAFLDDRKSGRQTQPKNKQPTPEEDVEQGNKDTTKEAAKMPSDRVEEDDDEQSEANVEEVEEEDLQARELVDDDSMDGDNDELSPAPLGLEDEAMAD